MCIEDYAIGRKSFVRFTKLVTVGTGVLVARNDPNRILVRIVTDPGSVALMVGLASEPNSGCIGFIYSDNVAPPFELHVTKHGQLATAALYVNNAAGQSLYVTEVILETPLSEIVATAAKGIS